MLYATVATTHLGNIRANLDGVRARVCAGRPARQVLLAIKANAYGHGAVEVARMVEATGCADRLGVATVPEGLELRDAGVRLPILKLSHALDADETRAAVERDITLTVVDAATIDAAEAAAAALGVRRPVHLKVDTGMRRIGCEPDAALALCRRVDAAPHLRLEGLFSHLPASDVPEGDAFTAAQIALFGRVAADAEAARGPIPLKHLAASAGVLAHPDAWFDMVRPGIMAYGHLPDPATAATVPLRPGLSWATAVSFVKPVAAGETVGYGRTWAAPRDTWIATLPVGYGDGYSRLLSNAGRVLIGGASRPIVGRVCMDQVMVDLGPGNPGRVAPGDRAVLLGTDGGEEITAQELADLMGTITYEVTCLVGARVERRYAG